MAAVSSIIAVVAIAAAVGSAYKANQQARAAAKDRKEAGQVSQAEQAAQQNQNRRQQIREERVRRAQITQASVNTGVSGSSGELGSQSALGSLIGGNIAASSRQQNSATAIGTLSQNAADKDLSSAGWTAVSSAATSIFGLAAQARLSSTPPNKVKPTAAQSQPSIFD